MRGSHITKLSRKDRYERRAGNALAQTVETPLGGMCFTRHYKKALQELYKERNLEAALFLRLLMETGIRARDIYQMDVSCIEGKRVKVHPSKIANIKYYQQPNGSLPRISKATLQIAAALDRTQGEWFTRPYDYYLHIIHKLWNQTGFSIYMLRKYWVESDRRRCLEQKKTAKA